MTRLLMVEDGNAYYLEGNTLHTCPILVNGDIAIQDGGEVMFDCIDEAEKVKCEAVLARLLILKGCK